jgi:hypothetical protein
MLRNTRFVAVGVKQIVNRRIRHSIWDLGPGFRCEDCSNGQVRMRTR